MESDLSDYRKSYQKDALLEENTPENPMELFRDWFIIADDSEYVPEANAMINQSLNNSIGFSGVFSSRRASF